MRYTVVRGEDELWDTRKPAFKQVAAAASVVKIHHREAPIRETFWQPPHVFVFISDERTCVREQPYARASFVRPQVGKLLQQQRLHERRETNSYCTNEQEEWVGQQTQQRAAHAIRPTFAR